MRVKVEPFPVLSGRDNDTSPFFAGASWRSNVAGCTTGFGITRACLPSKCPMGGLASVSPNEGSGPDGSSLWPERPVDRRVRSIGAHSRRPGRWAGSACRNSAACRSPVSSPQGELGPVGGKNFLHGFTVFMALFGED